MLLNLKIQKILYLIYFIFSIMIFVYALIFMTDYQELFGLQLAANKAIASFYTNQLQVFNRDILSLAVIMIVSVIVMKTVKVGSEVSNFYTLLIHTGFLLYVIIKAVLYIFSIKLMLHTYINLDYSKAYLEGLENYVINTRMLDFGLILSYILVFVALSLLVILIVNFFKYLSLNEGVKVYFQNLKKESIITRKWRTKNER